MFYTSPQTVFGTGAPTDASGAAASSVAVTPSGSLTASNAQAALVELQLDIDGRQPLHANLTAIAALAATKGNLIAGDGSNFVALGVGTNGYVMMADSAQTTGTKWASIAPSGTLAPFQQTAAPTGWTKQTTHDDKLIRVVSGTPGSGGSWTITGLAADAHTHTQQGTFTSGLNSSSGPLTGTNPATNYASSSHTHQVTISGATTAASATGVTHTPGWRPAYVDFIIAAKD
jgi:hypothetical protein